MRVEEVFAGMDAALAADSAAQEYSEIEAVRARFWRETPAERRAALLPTIWTILAPAGMLFGNAGVGSRVLVANPLLWSEPGYAEILTGRVWPEITGEAPRRYPHRTFLEYAAETLALPPTKVAQFGSWDGFKLAAASRDDAFFMNGAREAVPAELATPAMDRLVALRRQVMELWDESSNDVLTYHLATAYLEAHQPRILWLGLGQSDDWSHAGRYDRLLDYLHLADGLLGDLWATLQAHPAYAGRTSLVVTTDHGRGRTPEDWREHGAAIPGSEAIWMLVVGPDTPALGEHVPPGTLRQADVAATALTLLGLDWRAFDAAAGPPAPGIVDGAKH